MGKDKLKRFEEINKFSHVIQPELSEVFNQMHPLSGKWSENLFGNDNPITLELGCGKGEYTLGLAALYPNRNFIGVDIKGARIWKGAKTSLENNFPNVAFIRTRIEFIDSFFIKNEIDEIWITFPDPQMAPRREKKRLTSPDFLKKYQQFLRPAGTINLKTDSKFLYDYTLEVVGAADLRIISSTRDVHNENRDNLNEIQKSHMNIRTFYEKRWIRENIPINYLSFGFNS